MRGHAGLPGRHPPLPGAGPAARRLRVRHRRSAPRPRSPGLGAGRSRAGIRAAWEPSAGRGAAARLEPARCAARLPPERGGPGRRGGRALERGRRGEAHPRRVPAAAGGRHPRARGARRDRCADARHRHHPDAQGRPVAGAQRPSGRAVPPLLPGVRRDAHLRAAVPGVAAPRRAGARTGYVATGAAPDTRLARARRPGARPPRPGPGGAAPARAGRHLGRWRRTSTPRCGRSPPGGRRTSRRWRSTARSGRC